MTASLIADPFRETTELPLHARFAVLGADIEFESNSRELMRLATAAFSGLPRMRWSRPHPRLRMTLRVVPAARGRARLTPPAPRYSSGAQLLCAHLDAESFVVVAPLAGVALLQIPATLLHFPYHVRYELMEFAALTLAARAQRLVSLHGACVGRAGRGVLLLGDSGAGKSTLSLGCLLDGCALVSEDAVFANATDARLGGLANFMHVSADGLRFVRDRALRARIRASPRIRRRSGAQKFQLDMRAAGLRRARAPLELAATIVLSRQSTRHGPLLQRLDRGQLAAALRRMQPYAVGQPGWNQFERTLLGRGGFRLRRDANPDEAVRAVRALLDGRTPDKRK